jgi:hypothetical protein
MARFEAKVTADQFLSQTDQIQPNFVRGIHFTART